MIAAWMLYAAAAAALVALAAAGLDRALRLFGRPTRVVWAGALALSVAVPPAAWWMARERAAADASAAAAAEVAEPAPLAAAGAGPSLDELLARATIAVEPSSAWASLDAPLAALWGALSLALALWFLLAQRRLRRARREWRPAVVEEAPVLVSGRTGPAVAGVLRAAVVLPEWALSADRSLLQLMLAHEQEHVRAGDPRLLAGAAAAVALMPWNPALWWQLRQLRLAVEIDCDRRVLRRYPDVRRYGALLLEVGRLAGPTERLPLAAFTAPGSSLERRIRSMTMKHPRHPLLQGAAFAAAAGLLVLAACEMPHPTQVTPEGEIPLNSIRESALRSKDGISASAIRAAVERTMPELLTERTGAAVPLWFVADAEDRVLRVEMLRTGGRYEVRGLAATPAPNGEGMRIRARSVQRMEGDASISAGLDPDAIASVEIMRLPPGRVIADSASVVWVRLKPGATLEAAERAGSARATMRQRAVGEALRASEARPASGTVRLRTKTPAVAEAERHATEAAAQRRRTVTGEAMLRVSGVGDSGAVRLRSVDPNDPQPAPLYVIDGERLPADVAAERVEQLAPARIESIEVLKGAAAERIYGSEGRHGVIHITTKKAP